MVGERFGVTSYFWAVIKAWIWHANASQASIESRPHPDLLSVRLGHLDVYGEMLDGNQKARTVQLYLFV